MGFFKNINIKNTAKSAGTTLQDFFLYSIGIGRKKAPKIQSGYYIYIDKQNEGQEESDYSLLTDDNGNKIMFETEEEAREYMLSYPDFEGFKEDGDELYMMQKGCLIIVGIVNVA